MKHGQTSLALRQIRAHFAAPLVVPIMIAVILVLGLSGPFGTFDGLPLLMRIAYWGFIVVLTYGTGITVISYATLVLPTGWSNLLRDAVAGLIAGPFITCVVVVLNALTFVQDADGFGGPTLISLAINCTAIAIVVSVLIGQIESRPKPDDGLPEPALLDRLAFEKRGALISLQAQDHYVMVTTQKGSQLVLMRIADAIAEVTPTRGFQTHRSFWVARDQIARSVQGGEKGTLHMVDGSEIPVSRKYMPVLKAAGFFS